MTSTLILFGIGLLLLIKGADVLVDGSISIAKKLQVSNIIIGLTIVSFGTSLPELLVNIHASIAEDAGIAIGTVLGSNVANLLLVLGSSAFFFPLLVQKRTAYRTIPFSLLVTVLLAVCVNFNSLTGKSDIAVLGLISGIIFLVVHVGFLILLLRRSDSGDDAEDEGLKTFSMPRSVILIIAGSIALTFGGKWTVDGAVKIAEVFHVSSDLIGFTIVAVGTCLPELVTSVVAAIKKNPDIAVGNVVGSNIFNILWVLGVSSIIRPLPFTFSNTIDIGVVSLATVILFLLLFIGKKLTITWWKGLTLIILYTIYIIYLVTRG